MSSIRTFLVVVLMASMTLIVFLSALHGYRASLEEARDLFDEQLAERARQLAVAGSDLSNRGRIHHMGDQHAFQVWRDGKLLHRSDNAPDTPVTSVDQGYQDVNFHGRRWRTFTFDAPEDRLRIVAAERMDLRNVLAEDIILASVLPVVAALPVAGLLIWIVVGYGMAPLRTLADELRERRASDLNPLPLERQPVELMQVVSSINGLFRRLDAAFSRERQFASNAAHELRTPISALNVHLHNVARALPPGDRDLAALNTAAERMRNVVEQILSLYRTSPDHYAAQFTDTDLHRIARDTIAAAYPGFRDKRIRVELNGKRADLSGDPFALETLLKNLLDNARKYTPEGGRVRVWIEDGPDAIRLGVEDSGPGVPEPERRRIFERFYRAGGDRHDSGVVGCGLGLAIARHIADLHGASIRARDSGFESGLCVEVTFPGAGRLPAETGHA